ncbi:MAG: FAD-dependent oxidoreductase [Firmicutes bacterium]|nr:FAD-dependent oxidoreductase [Bacillota bacterium]
MEKYTFAQPPHPYWLASTSDADYPVLDRDIKVDAAIIGGGITGISCAYLLKKAGLSVAVLEADRLGQGATGHTTAKITSQHGLIYNKIKKQMGMEAAQQYAAANEQAIREIEAIIQEKEIDCDFSRQTAYVYTERDGYVQEIEEEAKLAQELGIEANFVTEIELPIKIKAAVSFGKQAQFHPRKYLLALAQDIPDDNSHIFIQSRVVDIDEEKNYLITTAAGKKVVAEKVIIASHYPCYNKAGLYFARLFPHRSYVVAIKAQEAYPGGMYITAEEPGRSFRSLPTEDGELIMIGGEHHKTGQGVDTRQHYQNLVAYAREVYPGAEILYRWSTQDYLTPDQIPYAGYFLPNTPNLFLATGFRRWGMTNSMVSAMIIRDLIVSGESPWQDLYNPSRQTIAASGKTFVVENLNVANQLIKGKLSAVPTDTELEAGEAKVIMIDGDKVGVYKDEKGTQHLVDTTCTHLGCELKWNAAEKSWDCPCHGSRFTYEGEIIEGPAVKPLRTVKGQTD